MYKTFLKVLKYLGVALLGAFTGIGALIGISSCQANKLKSANADSKGLSSGIYRVNSYLNISSFSRALPDESNMDIMTSFKIRLDGGTSALWSEDFGTKVYDELYIYVNITNHIYYYDQAFINFTYGGSNESVILFEDEYSDYDYYLGNQGYSRFSISDNTNIVLEFPSIVDDSLSNYEIIQLHDEVINYFYNDFDVLFSRVEKINTFTFYDNFNYNAPYSRTINDLFISDADFTSSNPTLLKTKTFSFNYPFISNGEVYNTIKVNYLNGYATRYLDGSSVRVNSSVGYGYFTSIIYENSSTSTSKVVANRNYVNKLDGGDLQLCLTSGATWVNGNYQKLTFLGILNSASNTNLSQFNNNLDVNGINTSGGDIGLGNVFTLISHAFASWLPIFNIQIIPGITIGLLLFLPLITGIIIFIIWLVKR